MNDPRITQHIPLGKVLLIGLIVAILTLGLAGSMLFDRYLQFIRLFSA